MGEKNPFPNSKILGEDGGLKMLFHGTRYPELAIGGLLPSQTGAQGPGIYLSDLAEGECSEYGEFTIPVYANITNPWIFHPSDESLEATVNGELLEQILGVDRAQLVIDRMDKHGVQAYGTEVMDALQINGYDGIVMVYPWAAGILKGSNVVIAFHSHQVVPALVDCWVESDRDFEMSRPVMRA